MTLDQQVTSEFEIIEDRKWKEKFQRDLGIARTAFHAKNPAYTYSDTQIKEWVVSYLTKNYGYSLKK